MLVATPDIGLRAVVTVLFAKDFRILNVLADGPWCYPIDPRRPSLAIVDANASDASRLLRFLRSPAAHCRVLFLGDPARLPLSTTPAAVDVEAVLETPFRLGALFAAVAKLVPHSRVKPIPQYSPEVTRAMDLVWKSYSAELTVADLALAAHLSPSRFAHRFIAETGTTPRRFLRLVRINVAGALLSETDAKLECVAKRAGFYDGSHLSRVFSKCTGLNPGAHRRAARRGLRLSCGTSSKTVGRSRLIQQNDRTVH
jgi:AraC-like DNA-binding protein